MRFRRSPLVLFLAMTLLAALPAHAVEPDEVLQDPALETRAREISEGLRCLVCQNQSIDDSGAPLAKDLRLLVRERLKAGDSNQQIVDFIVARYGEFVLLNPRLSWHTALLWGLPPAILLLGLLAIVVVISRRRITLPAEAPNLDAAEEARLSDLLHRES